jgi:hypothetical protein
MNFSNKDTENWKIFIKLERKEDKSTKAIEDKIDKFITTNGKD